MTKSGKRAILATLCAAALLAACGGGSGTAPTAGADTASTSSALRLDGSQSAAVDASLCATGAGTGDVSYALVDGQCMRVATAIAPATASSPARAQKAAAAKAIDTNALMDWAEATYPQYFSGTAQGGVSAPYTYRFYKDTLNYLGVDGQNIYVLGPVSGNAIAYVGSFSSFTCLVYPENCATAALVPGAPAIRFAVAGNASANVGFTAPVSNGNSTITGYVSACAAGSASKSATGTSSPIVVTGLANGTAYACTVSAINAVGTGGASSALSVTPSGTAATTTRSTSGTTSTTSGTTTASTTTNTSATAVTTAGVMCSFSQSVTNVFLNMLSTAAISCSGGSRNLTGNGVPDHTPGTFPNAGNPNAIAAQSVHFTNTTSPAVVAPTGTAVAHILGFANNSVKFDPSTAESYQNAGVWNIEALNQTYFAFGVDSSNAHVQPGGGYHYHGMPEGYITRLGKGTGMALVGFAVDGFPIYARYGYSTALNASSATKVMSSSWRLKTTPSSGRPSTSAVAMGTFTQDYEYVAGLGDLDECNGRFGVTPEFPQGIYHYYITDGYPYIQRCVKGTAAPTGG